LKTRRVMRKSLSPSTRGRRPEKRRVNEEETGREVEGKKRQRGAGRRVVPNKAIRSIQSAGKILGGKKKR